VKRIEKIAFFKRQDEVVCGRRRLLASLSKEAEWKMDKKYNYCFHCVKLGEWTFFKEWLAQK
jgi:hypothetical protein